jgi:two-component system nitrate/nitrite response regulator NarL
VDASFETRQTDPYVREAPSLRIVIVSEVRFLRESVAEILERDRRVSVVGIYADLAQSMALCASLRPDIVLLDAAFRGGAAAVARSRHIAPELRIIVFAVQETESDIIAWAEAGAIGYVPSSAGLSDLVRLVMDIRDGEQLCSGRVAAGLFRRIAVIASLSGGLDPPRPASTLTAREQQAAELIRTGLCDKEIARRLNISLATTKSHVHSQLGKLNVQRRGQVAPRLREYVLHPG